MIIVNPLGFGIPNPANGFDLVTANLKDRTKLFNAFAASLLDEVIPIVEKTYRVARNRDARAIAGLSSGGATSRSTARTPGKSLPDSP